MNSITQESRSPDVRKIVCWLLIVLLSLLSLTGVAQDCDDTAYLESQTIKAGELVTIVAGTINNQPGKQFVIEDQAHAVLQAGKRIELNYGFKALNGSGLIASIVPCDPEVTPPSRELVVYPNPTDGILNIKAPYIMTGIRLSDMSGFLHVEKREINDTVCSLDISEVKAGIYILEIIADNSEIETVRVERK
jgi:hypothetical protein